MNAYSPREAFQLGQPLTPALSPQGGERVISSFGVRRLMNDDLNVGGEFGFPLPIRWGEGQGEGVRR